MNKLLQPLMLAAALCRLSCLPARAAEAPSLDDLQGAIKNKGADTNSGTFKAAG